MGVDLGAQEPALLLSSLMVMLSFGALSVFKLCCEHSFCGTLVCLSCCDLLGEETLGIAPQLPGKPHNAQLANHRANGLWDPCFPQLRHSGIL